MATNAEQNQLNKANQNDQQSTGAGVTDTPGSRVASFSSGAAPSAAQGSGRFTNLKKYVNANQGAGEQLGSKITSNIDKSVEKTNKEATTQASGIANAIDSEKNRLAEANTFKGQLQDQTANGAQAIYGNTDARSRFSNLLNNQNVASNLTNQAQAAQQQATSGFGNVNQQVQNLGTEQGRFALLQQSVKNPQYTQGQQRLDQLFMQAGNPNQLVQSQRDLSNKVGTYGNQLNHQFTDLGSQIGTVGTQAEDVSKMLGQTLGSETQNLTAAQQQEAQQLNTQYGAANTAMDQFFTSGYDTLTEAQKAIINPMLESGQLNAGMRTYNVLNDPQSYQKYVTKGRTDLAGQDVLDANELARYNALFGLAGGTGQRAFEDRAGNAGPAANINAQQLGSDISNARQNFIGGLGQATGSANESFNNNLNRTEVALQSTADLKNLFNQYDTGTSKDQLTGIDPTSYNGRSYAADASRYFNQVDRPDWDFGGTTQAAIDKASAVAREQILQQFLDQLQAGGYNTGLGGVMPGSSPTPTDTFKVK